MPGSRRPLLCLSLTVLILHACAPSSSDTPTVGASHQALEPSDLRHRLEPLVEGAMDRLEAVPGLALAVVDRDGVLIERGWGLRDVANELPVTPDTGFYIASSTKSYVGLLTALLDHQGVLDLDAPLTACIPELSLNDVVDPASLTLRDMLRHTRGWDDDPVETRTAYTDFIPPRELLDHLATRATPDPPYQYGNIGYIVVDLCYRVGLERSWKELLEARVLTPAGLRHTTPYMSEAAGTGNLALPYLWNGERHRAIPPKTDAVMHAAGGLVTTARDAGRWIRLHLGDGVLDGVRIFPAGPIRETLTRQVDTDDSFWEFTRDGYGLGWFDGSYRGERLLHHFGGYLGAQAHVSMMPERGIGVAAFINAAGGGSYLLPHIVAAFVYDALAGRPDAEERARRAVAEAAEAAREQAARLRELWDRLDGMRADPAPLAREPERYAGVYRHPGAGVIDVSTTPEGGLWVNWGAREGDLLSLGGDAFLADWEPGGPADEVRFEIGDDGRAVAFLWGNVTFRKAPF